MPAAYGGTLGSASPQTNGERLSRPQQVGRRGTGAQGAEFVFVLATAIDPTGGHGAVK
jgi:hypothetical protein